MSYIQQVTEAARSLDLLEDDGKLADLDSLSVLDLITELENRTRISIPTSEIRADAFESVETVAALLTQLAA